MLNRLFILLNKKSLQASLKKLWLVTAVLCVVCAVFLTAARILTPSWTPKLEIVQTQLERQIHHPVTIQKISLRWQGLQPVLELDGVSLLNDGRTESLLTLKSVVVGIDPISSLIQNTPVIDHVILTGFSFAIVQDKNGQYSVTHFSFPVSQKAQSDALKEAIASLLLLKEVQIKSVDISFQATNEAPITFHIRDATIKNQGEVHTLAGSVSNEEPLTASTTALTFSANFEGVIPTTVKDVQQIWTLLEGQSYFNLEGLSLKRWGKWLQWQHWLPLDGKVNLTAWSSWEKGQLQSTQMVVNSSSMFIYSDISKKIIEYTPFKGHIDWKRIVSGGWILEGDKILLGQHGQLSPLRNFVLAYNPVNDTSIANVAMEGNVPTAAEDTTKILTSATTTSNFAGTYSLRFNEVNIEQAINIAKDFSLIPETHLDNLAILNPQGNLIDLNFRWSDILPSTKPLWSVDTYFRAIAFKRLEKIPGANGLSGHIFVGEKGGEVLIHGKLGTFDFGPVFRQELQFNKFKADIQWKKENAAIDITADKITASNNDINLHAKGSLKIPLAPNNTLNETNPAPVNPSNHNGTPKNNAFIKQTLSHSLSPIIDLEAEFSVSDASKKSLYLPVSVLKPKVVKWLDKAIIAGKSSHGILLLKGVLSDFPFDKNNGTFLVDAQITDAELDYVPEWPVLKDLSLRLIFEGHSMRIEANSGSVMGAHIQSAVATIPILAKGIDAVLTVQGKVTGDLKQGWRFLQESPLKKSYGRYLESFNLRGPLQLGLQIVVPLENDTDPVRVSGAVNLQQAQLQLPLPNLAVNQLQGDVQFTEQSITAPQLIGQLFDQPLHLSIQPSKQSITALTPVNTAQSKSLPNSAAQNNGTIVAFDSQVPIKSLAYYFPSEYWQYFDGLLQYQGSILFSSSATRPDQLILKSDLKNVQVALPTPLTKSAMQILPSQVTINLGKSRASSQSDQYRTLTASYGDRLGIALALTGDPSKKMGIYGGELRFGNVIPPNVDTIQSGLKLSGQFAELPWQEWRDFMAKSNQNKQMKNSRNQPLFRGADLQISHFKLWGQDLSPVRLQLNRSSNRDAWQVGIQSRQVTGKLLLPDQVDQTIVANFQQLYLAQSSETMGKLDPTNIPPVDFYCNDFHQGSVSFGTVKLQLRPTHNGLDIAQLNVANPAYTLLAQGNWSKSRSNSVSALSGTLKSNDFSKALRSWDIPAAIESKRATISFDLQWMGAPYDFTLSQTSGRLHLDLANGQLADVGSGTAMNLGKVLNLLSIQSITRRIQLDFSDLTGTGFAFDKFAGDIRLSNGIADVNHLELFGPVAAVNITGKIGLAQKDYHLLLHIQPHLTSSLPLVATLTAGPVVGAVAWVANKVLSPEFEKITRYTYEMIGPWSKPIIQSVSDSQTNDKR